MNKHQDTTTPEESYVVCFLLSNGKEREHPGFRNVKSARNFAKSSLRGSDEFLRAVVKHGGKTLVRIER